MTTAELQVLVEVDQGEYHAHQCDRARNLPNKHVECIDAFNRLLMMGYIKLVGDEYSLTNEGTDLVHFICRSNVLVNH